MKHTHIYTYTQKKKDFSQQIVWDICINTTVKYVGSYMWLCSALAVIKHVCMLSCLSSVPFFCDLMSCSLPGSSVHGILRQEYWSGLPCPPPGDLPHPRIEPTSLQSPSFSEWVLYHQYHTGSLKLNIGRYLHLQKNNFQRDLEHSISTPHHLSFQVNYANCVTDRFQVAKSGYSRAFHSLVSTHINIMTQSNGNLILLTVT